MLDYVFKRTQKVLLKFEVGKLFDFEKLHGKLPKLIKSKESDYWIVVTSNLVMLKDKPHANLVKMLSEDCPHARPFDANPVHVVVADFDKPLQRIHPWLLVILRGGYLVLVAD